MGYGFLYHSSLQGLYRTQDEEEGDNDDREYSQERKLVLEGSILEYPFE